MEGFRKTNETRKVNLFQKKQNKRTFFQMIILFRNKDSFVFSSKRKRLIVVFFVEDVLSLTLNGIRGQVDKHRTLFVTGGGQTKIHIDQVKDLQSSIFIKLEVVRRDGQTVEQGHIHCKRFMPENRH